MIILRQSQLRHDQNIKTIALNPVISALRMTNYLNVPPTIDLVYATD
jgi:uncharacterized membrane protein